MLVLGALLLVVVVGAIIWAAVASADSTATTAVTPTGTATSAPTPSSSPSPDATATSAPATNAGDGVRATSEPNPFDSPAEIVPGVSASIGAITSVTGVAAGVGESGGPAIRFEVTIANAGEQAIDLQNTRVTVDSGANSDPASELSGGPDIVAFPASLEPGASATAAYVFTVPVEGRSDVRITLDYLAAVPFVVFAGAAPTS